MSAMATQGHLFLGEVKYNLIHFWLDIFEGSKQ